VSKPGTTLRVLQNADEVARAAADRLQALIANVEAPVLALPTGRTPVPFYDELARRYAAGQMSLAAVRGFNLDEVLLPPEDPRSFRSFMERHAWGRTGLRRERCDIPAGDAPDPAAECQRYEEAISAAGGLDVAILGLGVDGHVAYNMPGPVELATHVVRLPDGLAASLGIPETEWPLRAITMGLGTIASARTLLVLATGPTKVTAVRALLEGIRDPEWPCSFLSGHPQLEVLVDRPAVAALPEPMLIG
jgi:glucosamine-6-phosphate deaminase